MMREEFHIIYKVHCLQATVFQTIITNIRRIHSPKRLDMRIKYVISK
jgi:hypothetical protein